MLTIAGERLELTRVMRHSRMSHLIFIGIIAAYVGGLLLNAFQPASGIVVIGVSLFTLGLWLLRYDIARRTVKQSGLTRYIAVCLLAGYAWLLVAGGLRLGLGAQIAGPAYDAQLHSVLLGFVFSMILGHAPIILPAVLNVSLPFHWGFYLPLALLHASLLLRVGADLGAAFALRQWGGMLNVIAVLLFLLVTASVVYRANVRNRADRHPAA